MVVLSPHFVMSSFKTLPKNSADWVLLLVRVSVGATFIAHGITKWATWNEPTQGGMDLIMKLLGLLEPVMGAATILGLLAPVAAVVLGVVMLGAIYMKMFMFGGTFAGKGGWEFDLSLLAGNAVLYVFGPGALSMDTILRNNMEKKPKKKR